MKISIITPTYNSAKTIKDTIESVIVQTEIQTQIQTRNHPQGGQFPIQDLEYIVIDGASTDDTKNIISKFQKELNIKLVSEPD
ncbi:MAG: glycosyltransferase, partial [bacterium]